MIKTELLRADHPVALRHAVDVLQHGGMVAFPTDTVYGLATLPFKANTVEQLFTAKGRLSSRAIAVLIGDIAHLSRVTSGLNENADHLVKRFWPGPLTLVVPKHVSLPELLSQNQTVGVRMPDHPVALMLLREIGPLAVTSANLSGSDNANTAQEVQAQLEGRVHLIIDGGRTPGGVPSTVVDCTGPELSILRSGPISLEEIEKTLAESEL
jgi:L-threonylcarbamoyladenylate synthase